MIAMKKRLLSAGILFSLLFTGFKTVPDLLPPPAGADFSPYRMTVPLPAPVEAPEISSPFGWRYDPFTGEEAFHSGLDLAAPEGSEIRAVLGGEAARAGYDPSYGNYLLIDHYNGFSTLYAHCSALFVREGDPVAQGQVIAAVGSTGRADGSHLHFEIRFWGTLLDPAVGLCLKGAGGG